MLGLVAVALLEVFPRPWSVSLTRHRFWDALFFPLLGDLGPNFLALEELFLLGAPLFEGGILGLLEAH